VLWRNPSDARTVPDKSSDFDFYVCTVTCNIPTMIIVFMSQVSDRPTVVKVKGSRYRPGVDQRVGRGIALLFHDRGTRMGRVVSSTPWPHFTPGKDPVPILQKAGWAPGQGWTGGKSRPNRDSIPDRPARSRSLYRLSYPAHRPTVVGLKKITVLNLLQTHNLRLTLPALV